MTKQIPLRAKKKGLLKLLILDKTLELLKDFNFEDIKVKEICRLANTSEVTFFKYFEKKEQVLQYFMLIWNYKREMRVSKAGRDSGRKAIYSIFEDISQTPQSQKIMLTLFNYVARLREKPKAIALNSYEKQLLFEEEKEIEPLSLSDQFILHLRESLECGELPDETDLEKMVFLLSSIYYGSAIIAHTSGRDLGTIYKDNLEIILERRKA